MRQVRAVIGDIVNIKEPRAGNMGLRHIRPSASRRLLRQVPGPVQNPQVRVLEMGSKPFGRNEGFRIVLHQSLSKARLHLSLYARALRVQDWIRRCPPNARA